MIVCVKKLACKHEMCFNSRSCMDEDFREWLKNLIPPKPFNVNFVREQPQIRIQHFAFVLKGGAEILMMRLLIESICDCVKRGRPITYYILILMHYCWMRSAQIVGRVKWLIMLGSVLDITENTLHHSFATWGLRGLRVILGKIKMSLCCHHKLNLLWFPWWIRSLRQATMFFARNTFMSTSAVKKDRWL